MTDQLVLSQNAKDITAVSTISNTDGWQNWQTVSITINLQAGQQDLSVYVRKGGWSFN